MQRGMLWVLACALASALWLSPISACAKDDDRPKVVLDQLEFPVRLGASKYKEHLRRVLQREVRQVDWGASSDSTIEYRYRVTKLTVAQDGDVLRVTCEAVGMLPRGRSAKSQLTFGGSPREHTRLIQRVLTIVARGVITRLAEMERVRRGELRNQRVKPPPEGAPGD